MYSVSQRRSTLPRHKRIHLETSRACFQYLSRDWPRDNIIVCVIMTHTVERFKQYCNLLFAVPSSRAETSRSITKDDLTQKKNNLAALWSLCQQGLNLLFL